MQNRHERLHAALTEAFHPAILEIVDDSARHAGHSGAAAGGETHYNVLIVSATFASMSRVQRSRAVHEAVSQELGTGLHALSLTLRTPEEDAKGEDRHKPSHK